jgi:hypothetical protein
MARLSRSIFGGMIIIASAFGLAAVVMVANGLAVPIGPSDNSGPQLDLNGYVVSFDDSFKDLSISAHGGGTRWIAHTPWNGDFGDAAFADPGPGGPFSLSPEGLVITASRDAKGRWRSGLIASRDKDGSGGEGFAQKYGYFEMRAKLPGGKGVWPAFWLIGTDKGVQSSEIDILEYYGLAPTFYHSVAHLWSLQGKDVLDLQKTFVVPVRLLETQFNDYGVMIEPERTSFYLNRRRTWDIPTPEAYKQPMYLLANLALGGGWPVALDGPVKLQIAHIRVYQRKSAPASAPGTDIPR